MRPTYNCQRYICGVVCIIVAHATLIHPLLILSCIVNSQWERAKKGIGGIQEKAWLRVVL